MAIRLISITRSNTALGPTVRSARETPSIQSPSTSMKVVILTVTSVVVGTGSLIPDALSADVCGVGIAGVVR